MMVASAPANGWRSGGGDEASSGERGLVNQHGVGLDRLGLRLVGCVLVLGLAVGLGSPAGAATQMEFPRPAKLEPNVQFWVDVFTFYSYRDLVVFDRDRVWKVYQVLHLPGSGAPSTEQVERADAYLKAKYSHILTKLAAGGQPLGEDERRVAELFRGEPLDHYAAAAANLRVQQGLRERFREGLLRARNYLPTMERIFHVAGLPVELAVMASVESGYQNNAYSRAGAVGMWQFVRPTGKKYLKITRRYDERLHPFRATKAAAELLRYNYELLGSWPLAITAYNYGTSGMARAAATYGSDFLKILNNFDGPRFGFASRNYYAEFLAALQVHRYEDDYFPGIAQEATPPAPPILLRARYVRSRPSAGRYGSGRYRVRRGDTPAAIAQRYGVSTASLISANGIRDPRRLRQGQMLRVPLRHRAREVHVREDHYTIRSGDTLYDIARALRTSVNTLIETNRIEHPRALTVGRIISIPGT